MRSVGNVVSTIWTVLFVMQVHLLDFLVRFVESSSKDVFDTYVNI